MSQADVISASLHLTATSAVEVGLADKVMNSVSDVLTEMNLPKAKLTNAAGIDTMIKKYSAARRNIADALVRIQSLEERSSQLQDQLTDIEKQLRTGTVTQEVSRNRIEAYRRSDNLLPNNYQRYYYEPLSVTVDGIALQGSRYRNRNNRGRFPETVVQTTQTPAAGLGEVRGELLGVLDNLTAEYKRITVLAKRWPGVLPPELPLQTLEKNNTTAESLRNYLRTQPLYNLQQQQQVTQPAPGTSRSSRGRY